MQKGNHTKKNIKEIKLFGLPNSLDLAKKTAAELGIELDEVKCTKFSDGEKLLKPSKVVRNLDVFVIAETSNSETLMDLLIFVDSLKRASAKSITVINSYYGYSRQDRKSKGREPITAKLIASLLEAAGVQHLVTVDLHNPSIQGFFNIPVDDIKWSYNLANYLKFIKKEVVIVSPDHGGTVRARNLADLLHNNNKIAVIDKWRSGPNKSEVMNVLGDVKGENVLIFDDIIDTGGTILKAAKILKERGAKDIYVGATHGIFSKSFKEFEESENITKVFISDSISNPEIWKSKKIDVISIAPIFAVAINSFIHSVSFSTAFQKMKNNNKKQNEI